MAAAHTAAPRECRSPPVLRPLLSQETRSDLKTAVERLQATEIETSRAIAPAMRQDESKYTDILLDMSDQEKGVLEDLNALVGSLDNVGTLVRRSQPPCGPWPSCHA